MLDADLKMEVALAEGVSSRHRNGLASGMKVHGGGWRQKQP
jgi:hypothetical protein